MRELRALDAACAAAVRAGAGRGLSARGRLEPLADPSRVGQVTVRDRRPAGRPRLERRRRKPGFGPGGPAGASRTR